MYKTTLTPRVAKENSDTSSTYVFNSQQVLPSVGNQWSSQPQPILVSVERREMAGYNTPLFHAAMKRGELIRPTPWYQREQTGSISASHYDIRYGQPGSGQSSHEWIDGPIWFGADWVPSDIEIAQAVPTSYDAYVADAASAIFDGSWDALTFVAELSQLKGLLTHALSALSKLSIPRNIRQVSSAWLKYRYGWSPFISDISAINGLLRSACEGSLRRIRKKKSGTYSTSISRTESHDYGNPALNFSSVIEDEIVVRSVGSVVADIIVPKIRANLLVTGWELIPFSFVIDWFFTIGSTISALSVITNSVDYVASAGYRLDYKRKVVCTTTPGPWYHSGSAGSTAQSTTVITRREPRSIPIIPRTRVRLNWKRIIDSLALILQRLR